MRTSRSALLCLVVLAFASQASPAAITGASGRVEASVEQTSAATGQIIDQALEETPGTTNILPAEADAGLDIATPSDLAGRLAALATVNLPGEMDPAETNDFDIEAAGLSTLEDRAFTSTARATQTRQIVFGASEFGLAGGTRVQARSDFVLSAGLLLVTLPEGPQDVIGQVSVVVRQQEGDETRTVLDGQIEVGFNADGQLEAVTRGDLMGQIVIPVDLSGESGEIDQAWLILLPGVILPYEYEATIDEPFSLTAEITATVDGPSGAQGGSVFVGRLPREFSAITDEFLGFDFDAAIDTATDIIALRQVGTPKGTTVKAIDGAEGAGCGGFGLESLLGGLLLAAGFVTRRLA